MKNEQLNPIFRDIFNTHLNISEMAIELYEKKAIEQEKKEKKERMNRLMSRKNF